MWCVCVLGVFRIDCEVLVCFVGNVKFWCWSNEFVCFIGDVDKLVKCFVIGIVCVIVLCVVYMNIVFKNLFWCKLLVCLGVR